jgi:MFS family permease
VKKKISFFVILIGILVEVTWVAGIVSGPIFMQLLNLSNTQLGIALGSLNIGLFLFSPVAGNVSGRLGAPKILFYGLLGMVLGTLLVVIGLNYLTLVLGMVITGIANAFIINSNMTVLSELFPGMIRRIISFYSAVYFAACALLSPVIGQWLKFSSGKEWDLLTFRVPFFILFFIFIYFSIIAFKYILPMASEKKISVPQQEEEEDADEYVTPVKWLWVPLLSFFHGLMYIVMISWLSPMAKEKFNANAFQGSLFVGAATMGMALGRLLIAFLEIPWGDRKVLSVGTIVGGILFLMGLFTPDYLVSLFLIWLGSLIASASFPCISSLGGSLFKNSKAKVYGYLYSTYALAGIIGTPFAGMLADKGVSLSWVLTISAFSAILIGVTTIIWEHLEKQQKKRLLTL